jgi:hypothetical protein
MTTPGPVETPHGGHEERDVSVGRVFAAVAGVGAVIVLTFVAMRGLLAGYEARPGTEAPRLAAEYGRTAPPEPRLQTNPREDLRRLHEQEDALLNGWAWVDRSAGTARIPIDRAMALLAERAR